MGWAVETGVGQEGVGQAVGRAEGLAAEGAQVVRREEETAQLQSASFRHALLTRQLP